MMAHEQSVILHEELRTLRQDSSLLAYIDSFTETVLRIEDVEGPPSSSRVSAGPASMQPGRIELTYRRLETLQQAVQPAPKTFMPHTSPPDHIRDVFPSAGVPSEILSVPQPRDRRRASTRAYIIIIWISAH